jgi:hypothetical protein
LEMYLPFFDSKTISTMYTVRRTIWLYWLIWILTATFSMRNCALKKIIWVFGDSLIIYILFMPYYYILWDFRIIEIC